jgi:phenylpropionate dioxygenase-like ring-hydroxylating dioxygenase large terminal subunit
LALSGNLVAGDAPTPARPFGENYIAFPAENGRIGFFDELCPHRRASLALARVEGNGLLCIYHGCKMDVAGRLVRIPQPFDATLVGGESWRELEKVG